MGNTPQNFDSKIKIFDNIISRLHANERGAHHGETKSHSFLLPKWRVSDFETYLVHFVINDVREDSTNTKN